MDTITINGKTLEELGVDGLAEYTVGGSSFDNQTFFGRNRTTFDVLASVPRLKTVAFTLAFKSATRAAAVMLKSRVDAEFVGKIDLRMPDDLYYTVYADGIGDLVLKGTSGGYIGTAAYKFKGICHGEIVTVTGNTVNCLSTTPRTDCKLEVTVPANATYFRLGTVQFNNVSAGDVLTADGLTGRILVNGAPASGEISFTQFPFLVPGENNIYTTAGTATVTYYPTYI